MYQNAPPAYEFKNNNEREIRNEHYNCDIIVMKIKKKSLWIICSLMILNIVLFSLTIYYSKIYNSTLNNTINSKSTNEINNLKYYSKNTSFINKNIS